MTGLKVVEPRVEPRDKRGRRKERGMLKDGGAILWVRELDETGKFFRVFHPEGCCVCYVPNTHRWAEFFSILLSRTPAFLNELVEQRSPLIPALIEELAGGNEHSREVAVNLEDRSREWRRKDDLQ